MNKERIESGQTDRQTKKLCFVILYFGKLPNTMDIWLKTCSYNPSVDFFLYTDDRTDFDYPDNVKKVQISFQEIREVIQNKFEFVVNIPHAKKLCDFKPAYGYIFEDELKEYRFWGYCDLDEYFGCMENFLSEEYLQRYDKIFSLGHMTIYRNTFENNRVFMNACIDSSVKMSSYKEVFTSSCNCVFDEWPMDRVNINVLYEKIPGISISYDWFMFDANAFKSYFQGVIYNRTNNCWNKEDNKNCILLWDKGHLFLYFKDGKRMISKEILYAHIQKRKLTVSGNIKQSTQFIIYPNIIRLNNAREFGNKDLFVVGIITWMRKLMHIDELYRLVTVQRERLKSIINKFKSK